MIQRDKIVGALLGTAVGDALGMPVEGLSHSNVRTYYKGIKEYRTDDQRGDLKAGQWTDDTQFTFAMARALIRTGDCAQVAEHLVSEYLDLEPEARRWGPSTRAAIQRLKEEVSWRESGSADEPTSGAPMRAAPIGISWAGRHWERTEAAEWIGGLLGITHRHPDALAAGYGQAYNVAQLLHRGADQLAPDLHFEDVYEHVRWAEDYFGAADRATSGRMEELEPHLGEWPLDLRDICDGVGVRAYDAWPFAVAMFVRNPDLVEATLLSAINVGGDADTVGAMLGAMLGALHGWKAFPDEWQRDLEAVERLEAEAHAMADQFSLKTDSE